MKYCTYGPIAHLLGGPKWPNTIFFLNFLATKHCLGNKWASTTFSSTRAHQTRVPHFSIPPWHDDMASGI